MSTFSCHVGRALAPHAMQRSPTNAALDERQVCDDAKPCAIGPFPTINPHIWSLALAGQPVEAVAKHRPCILWSSCDESARAVRFPARVGRVCARALVAGSCDGPGPLEFTSRTQFARPHQGTRMCIWVTSPTARGTSAHFGERPESQG